MHYAVCTMALKADSYICFSMETEDGRNNKFNTMSINTINTSSIAISPLAYKH